MPGRPNCAACVRNSAFCVICCAPSEANNPPRFAGERRVSGAHYGAEALSDENDSHLMLRARLRPYSEISSIFNK